MPSLFEIIVVAAVTAPSFLIGVWLAICMIKMEDRHYLTER